MDMKKCCCIVFIALLLAIIAFAIANDAQNSANIANGTANNISINITTTINNSVDRNLSNYTNTPGFITNLTMASDNTKVNKSGDNMTGQLTILNGDTPFNVTSDFPGSVNIILTNSDMQNGSNTSSAVTLTMGQTTTGYDTRFQLSSFAHRTDELSNTTLFNFLTKNAFAMRSNTVNRFMFYSNGSIRFNSLTNAAQSSSLCYNSATGFITYNSGVTTCLASNESEKNSVSNITAPITPFAMNLTAKKYKLNYEDSGQWHIGFMAQDIKNLTKGTIFNNSLVDYDQNGNVTGLQYEEMTALLLKVIQEQQTTINKICAKNATLCQ